MGIQVELLTKNKQPYQTQFIDFEYNGKKISDFGLVVVSNGDRLSFGHSPSFEDEVSEVAGYHGQHFWGTHFKTIQRTFQLATDGMTEQQWNAFKAHFIPGKYGKFIEHHLASRFSYCRVREISTLNIVPFQETRVLFGEEIDINIYKGSCSISFEWDDPCFYSISNLITQDDYTNDPKAAALAMYNDGVPKYNSWNKGIRCCIGDANYTLSNGNKSTITTYGGNTFPFYNPSITPSPCQLSLVFNHATSKENNGTYFSSIGDSLNGYLYNSVIIKDMNNQKFTEMRYTCPNIIYQVNKAIKLAYAYAENNTIHIAADLEDLLREEITNLKVMGWAANAIRAMCHQPTETEGTYIRGRYSDGTGQLNNTTQTIYYSLPDNPDEIITNNSATWLDFFNYYMLMIFAKLQSYHNISSLNLLDTPEAIWSWPLFTINFDSKAQVATASYSFNQIINLLENKQVSEEKCGDIMYSDYLKLDGNDKLDNEGKISSYHQVVFYYKDTPIGNDKLEHAQLFYQYTYL